MGGHGPARRFLQENATSSSRGVGELLLPLRGPLPFHGEELGLPPVTRPGLNHSLTVLSE